MRICSQTISGSYGRSQFRGCYGLLAHEQVAEHPRPREEVNDFSSRLHVLQQFTRPALMLHAGLKNNPKPWYIRRSWDTALQMRAEKQKRWGGALLQELARKRKGCPFLSKSSVAVGHQFVCALLTANLHFQTPLNLNP